MDNAAPLLRAEGLCFGYPQHTVFQDWSVDVGAGATLVLGGEGSGKTTLLRLLAGAVAADAGTLVLALVWIYYAALIIFVGALFTAVVDERAKARTKARAVKKRGGGTAAAAG